MSKELERPHSRLKNISRDEEAPTTKDSDKLIEVKKRDNGEDRENEFLVHEKPFDEQMHESFDDLRNDHMDEDAD